MMNACLQAVAVQLFDSNMHLISVRVRVVPQKTSVDATKAAFPDHEAPAKTPGGGFELGKGKDAEVVGSSLGQELVKDSGVGEVSGVIGFVIRAFGGVHGAEGASPGDF